MSVTTLDPKTALIVVDLQKGVTGRPLVHPIGEIVANANLLIDAFRGHGLPIVFVNVDGVAPGRTDAVRNLGPRPPIASELIVDLHVQPQDHRVTKRTLGAFTKTDLDRYLRDRAVTQVVVIGVATHAGVESTVRHAQELGFNVTVATDAVTDVTPEDHVHSINRIFPKISETGTTDEVISMLEKTRE